LAKAGIPIDCVAGTSVAVDRCRILLWRISGRAAKNWQPHDFPRILALERLPGWAWPPIGMEKYLARFSPAKTF